jgi:hypothetical protein
VLFVKDNGAHHRCPSADHIHDDLTTTEGVRDESPLGATIHRDRRGQIDPREHWFAFATFGMAVRASGVYARCV